MCVVYDVLLGFLWCCVKYGGGNMRGKRCSNGFGCEQGRGMSGFCCVFDRGECQWVYMSDS